MPLPYKDFQRNDSGGTFGGINKKFKTPYLKNSNTYLQLMNDATG